MADMQIEHTLGPSTEFAREKKVLVLKTGQCVSRNALCAAFH